MYGVKQGSKFILLHKNIQVKRSFSPPPHTHWIFLEFLSKSIDHRHNGFKWILHCYIILYIYSYASITSWLLLLCRWFWNWATRFPQFCFSFSSLFPNWTPSHFYMNFWIFLSVAGEKVSWNFDRHCVQSVDQFKSIFIPTTVNLLIHKDGITSHLLDLL